MSIIEQMRESGAELLQAESKDIAAWSKLRHTKQDLELFLNFNIAEIEFKTMKGEDRKIVCTSNMTLVKIMAEAKKQNKQKLAKIKSNGIRTKDARTVDTWDLVANKRKSISLSSWQIVNFISITPENILILDELAKKVIG